MIYRFINVCSFVPNEDQRANPTNTVPIKLDGKIYFRKVAEKSKQIVNTIIPITNNSGIK